MTEAGQKLPGEELVEAGLADLAAGRETEAALLAAIGATRLRRCGRPVPPAAELPAEPEDRLHRLIDASAVRAPHARYNSLVRLLVSYERALERERWRRIRSERSAPRG